MSKKRNYREPNDILDFCIALTEAGSLETHPAVLAAINAVASERRPALAIWTSPTGQECDHVVMALEEYIYLGDFAATADGVYSWGQDEIRI
ncbi:hypothetical protein [Methylocapsa acidiphila]|uniref:hypothetical protein n=1 Tax=Methylocapsa acidiphila TaxID=133552 RepID=UPI00040D17A1|nr:hypothetical protein [Methylocapsa acidiphila]